MEPKAMVEMQNELWNILQAMMTKKEPFENFKCEQHPTNSLTSVMTPAKVIINRSDSWSFGLLVGRIGDRSDSWSVG